MRKRVLLLTFVALPVLIAGCSWGIKLDAGGRKVRTAWLQDVSSCKNMGKITVSVMDRVGPIDRNGIKVADELEVMARNEAATMGADTVKPLGDPQDGAQSWGAYQCGSQQLPSAGKDKNPAAPQETGKAATYPMKSGG